MIFKNGEVHCVRLTCGDEILGQVNQRSNDTDEEQLVTFSKVRHILVQQTSDGIGISLMPWSFCNVDGDVMVNKDHIMAILSPDPEMVASYLKQTSKIQLL